MWRWTQGHIQIPALDPHFPAPWPHSGAWRCLPGWQQIWRPLPHRTEAVGSQTLSRHRTLPHASWFLQMLGQSRRPLHCRSRRTVTERTKRRHREDREKTERRQKSCKVYENNTWWTNDLTPIMTVLQTITSVWRILTDCLSANYMLEDEWLQLGFVTYVVNCNSNRLLFRIA